VRSPSFLPSSLILPRLIKCIGPHCPTPEHRHHIHTHTFPGSVDTPVLRASPSLALRIVHYIRVLLRIRDEMSIEECGERQLWGLLNVSAFRCFQITCSFVLRVQFFHLPNPPVTQVLFLSALFFFAVLLFHFFHP
jgi:hypothetical protein